MVGVICPECGAGGGSEQPCWCHNCRELTGQKVMMVVRVAGEQGMNWIEFFRSQHCPLDTQRGPVLRDYEEAVFKDAMTDGRAHG